MAQLHRFRDQIHNINSGFYLINRCHAFTLIKSILQVKEFKRLDVYYRLSHIDLQEELQPSNRPCEEKRRTLRPAFTNQPYVVLIERLKSFQY
jgi:hypothetical protein